ncbi:3-oxo-isoapionate-4-phosphate decarboxylase OiaX [Paracoccus spongiarum]|uniref:RuBisCO large subunit C-terminal-like domain-containing protein n=1 Tax=Paracoccus spongiarum TaxID=3064387 RepID=A0ABT9JBL0_9RHOB|nr:3-oxo-isoapionate-4-phosphate decarboxylase OiaX [Paracoccus sp. 2205BS29-5]MDP5307100.1 RuBisCO large subunit C-terminal-like domain-containing protein [Paracoccus sp. 2205BS29-5]
MSKQMIRVTYRIETPGDPEAMAAKIAADQSTGTFTPLPGETAALRARHAARVVSVTEIAPLPVPSLPEAGGHPGPFRRADVVIDYPLDSIGTDLAALMTVTMGGVFSVRGVTGIRILDLDLPDAFAGLPGPQFGIEGSRRLMGVAQGPMIASIIKPSLGLGPDETAEVVRRLCEAGVDFIKDDEKMMSPAYSPLAARVEAIMPVIRDHAQRTGRQVMYAFGISAADPDRMMTNHDLVVAGGGTAAVVNINSIGPGGMAFLRKRSQLCLHAHRNGWDVLTRHPGLGYDFRPYQKIWRLLGVDQFQVNGIGAKYWEGDDSFLRSFVDVTSPIFSDRDRALPVVCSGQWGGQAFETWARTGGTLDMMYLGGGGIHGHPGGPAAGVRAIRHAWQAASEGLSAREAVERDADLRAAFETWGR